jgi:hypothetical protein
MLLKLWGSNFRFGASLSSEVMKAASSSLVIKLRLKFVIRISLHDNYTKVNGEMIWLNCHAG